MSSLHDLALVLEASVRKRGEVPLTNAHLLNIVKMTMRMQEKREALIEDRLNEVLAEDKIWGSS